MSTRPSLTGKILWQFSLDSGRLSCQAPWPEFGQPGITCSLVLQAVPVYRVQHQKTYLASLVQLALWLLQSHVALHAPDCQKRNPSQCGQLFLARVRDQSRKETRRRHENFLAKPR